MHAFALNDLLEALDDLGLAATKAGQRLELVVYGGSALMLAGNFRFSTEDVDIAAIELPWPQWLTDAVRDISEEKGWSETWLNDAVAFHLSQFADLQEDHMIFGSFPRNFGPAGLVVHVPNAPYMLALKLKAMRVNDPAKGEVETADIENLLQVNNIASIDEAIAVLARYFPRSAQEPDMQRFVLRHIFARLNASPPKEDKNAPAYPVASGHAPENRAARKSHP